MNLFCGYAYFTIQSPKLGLDVNKFTALRFRKNRVCANIITPSLDDWQPRTKCLAVRKFIEILLECLFKLPKSVWCLSRNFKRSQKLFRWRIFAKCHVRSVRFARGVISHSFPVTCLLPSPFIKVTLLAVTQQAQLPLVTVYNCKQK